MANMIEQLMVGLGIDTKDFDQGIEGAKGKASRGASSIVSALSGIGGVMVVGALAAATAAITAVAAAATGGIIAVQDWANVLDSIGDVLGTTADESAALAVAIQGVGGNVGALTGQLAFLAKGLVDAEGKIGPTGKALQTLGINFQYSNGEMRPTALILQNVANVLAKMPDGLQKTALMTDLFGKSGKDLSDVMNALANGGLANAEKMAKSLGLALGDDATDAAIKFGYQINHIKLGLKGMMVQIGGALMPALKRLAEVLQTTMANPMVQAGIQSLVSGIAKFATTVIDWLPQVMGAFMNLFNWLRDNQGFVIGVLAAIGVAIAAFVYSTVIPAAIAVIAASWPIILVLMAIVAVVWLVYEAWTNNWGGIRDTLTAVWNGTIKPALQALWNWLSTVIPPALQKLSDYWNRVLLPAIQVVWSWIQTYIFPLFATLMNWMVTVITPALQLLSYQWNNVLLPALRAVWEFLTNYIFPIIMTVTDIIVTVFIIQLRILAGVWQNVLWPALQKVWSYFEVNILPTLKRVWDFIATKLSPVIQAASNLLGNIMVAALAGLRAAFDWILQKLQKLAELLKNLKLPKWLTPGSPTPFEMGLLGVVRTMDILNRIRIPELASSLADLNDNLPKMTLSTTIDAISDAGRKGTLYDDHRQANLTIYTNAAVEPVREDWGVLQGWLR